MTKADMAVAGRDGSTRKIQSTPRSSAMAASSAVATIVLFVEDATA
jgi:hypothetical protein